MFLPHLSYIDMSHNRLASIPESFGLLVHLKTLLLNNNRLVELPETFCLLARLEKADLSHNQLRFLPQSLGMMESLQSLNVSYNELDSLPVTLGKSKSLKLILAIFNKCILPPQQICNQDVIRFVIRMPFSLICGIKIQRKYNNCLMLQETMSFHASVEMYLFLHLWTLTQLEHSMSRRRPTQMLLVASRLLLGPLQMLTSCPQMNLWTRLLAVCMGQPLAML